MGRPACLQCKSHRLQSLQSDHSVLQCVRGRQASSMFTLHSHLLRQKAIGGSSDERKTPLASMVGCAVEWLLVMRALRLDCAMYISRCSCSD